MPSRARSIVLALALGAVLFTGCEKQRPAPTPASSAGATSARSYTVRGRVISLPDAPPGKRGLIVHHERIATFYNVRGENTGMNEMEMEFPWLGAGVSTSGLAPGDAVELTFRVEWDSERMYEVTSIRMLPKDTPLDLKAK